MDMISELPDDLLLRILSLLPTKGVAATMVLSKRWRSLWTMVPRLEYDSLRGDTEQIAFTEFVYRSLLSNKAPVLQSLRFCIDSRSTRAKHLRRWVEIAVERRVRELDILYKIIGYEKSIIPLPSSLYTCGTLETLILRECVLVDALPQSCFPSLKTIRLIGACNLDPECFYALLSSCPVLEDLVVELYFKWEKTYTIAVPSLQRLSTHNICGIYGGLVINAPSLKYLNIVDRDISGSLVVENMPKVVEAIVRVFAAVPSPKLLGSLASVRRLSLDVECVLLPKDIVFHQLVHLELYTRGKDWCDVLAYMLERSPNLRVLEIKNDWCDAGPRDWWKQPNHVPRCLLSSLETFRWKNCRGYLEKEVAEYILTNATCLKMASVQQKGYFDLEEQQLILQDRASMARGSTSLVFDD